MGADSGRHRRVNARVPGLGCGAALLDGGRVLLIKRRKPPEAGHWSLPGGKVEYLETVEDAVRREIREEIGVEIELLRPLFLSEMIGIDDAHWVSPVFEGRIISGEPRVCEPDKIGGLLWASLDDPPAPLASPARDAVRLLRQSGARAQSA